MSQRCRLPEGGRIDRSQPLTFRFDDVLYEGFAGDTLASALLANGVHFVARSFKYHRPRGIFSAGSEEPNALVQLGRGARSDPNTRATVQEVYPGLSASSQNRWPTLAVDIGALNGLASRLIPAGFYYKTFMWPPSAWRTYEEAIRRTAGLGRAPEGRDPDRYARRHAHCDVLVVGGGPAGLAAALAAGRAGARVILADDQSEPGGHLLGERETAIGGAPAMDWVAAIRGELAAMPDVTVLTRTAVTGYYDHNFLLALERVTDHMAGEPDGRTPRQRLWKIRAREVVLATGAIERPLVFMDNDRPGIMLAGAVRHYLNRYAVRAGDNALILTANDDAYRTAIDLRQAGAAATVVDIRPDGAGALSKAAEDSGVEVLRGWTITGTSGRRRVAAATLQRLNDSGKATTGASETRPADLIAVSGGWTPTVHLWSQSRGRLRFDDAWGAYLPDGSPQALRAAGACGGFRGLGEAIRSGLAAGTAAAHAAGHEGAAPEAPAVDEISEAPGRHLAVLPGDKPVGRGKYFIDLQNDVTAADVALAQREGYGASEHTKRYTTLGMGTDQGKTGNINGLAVLAELRSASIPELGHTTFRPPYTPLTFGAIAGNDVGPLFDPVRTTPMHRWHVANGAVFEDVGQWKRPRYFPKGRETMAEAVRRECMQSRDAVGLLDATTLGKIDIRGPDAGAFLDLVYTNLWSSLGVGRCRYGVMLNEHGMIFDDGVTTRFADDHFHMTTTTGGAARVLEWLEEWLQTEWMDMRVWCTSVTDQWAVATLSGPNARRLLAELTDIDLSPDAFPHMSVREGTVAGVPSRVFRIGFTGDLSYEINVPARYGLGLWEELMARGQRHGIVPFGTETMHVLRAEKGYIIVGQETDGTVTPLDLGMNWIVSKKKPDFLGRRSLSRPDTAREDRRQLVGLLTDDPAVVLPEGAYIVESPDATPPTKTIGHVTSAYDSPSVGRSIALALVAGGRSRHGETVHVALLDGRTVAARIDEPVFFDKEGARLDV